MTTALLSDVSAAGSSVALFPDALGRPARVSVGEHGQTEELATNAAGGVGNATGDAFGEVRAVDDDLSSRPQT